MPIPLIPVLIGGLAVSAAVKVRRQSNAMTLERQQLFDALIQKMADPVKLRAAAEQFQNYGLTKHADLLRKRANLRELPKEVQEARKEVFRNVMKLQDPDKVDSAADTFYSEGCIGAASLLRLWAEGLRSVDPMQRELIAKTLENKKGQSGKEAAKILRGK